MLAFAGGNGWVDRATGAIAGHVVRRPESNEGSAQMSIERIDNVGIAARDLDRVAGFFADVLGLSV
jgi:hypothetical protein